MATLNPGDIGYAVGVQLTPAQSAAVANDPAIKAAIAAIPQPAAKDISATNDGVSPAGISAPTAIVAPSGDLAEIILESLGDIVDAIGAKAGATSSLGKICLTVSADLRAAESAEPEIVSALKVVAKIAGVFLGSASPLVRVLLTILADIG